MKHFMVTAVVSDESELFGGRREVHMAFDSEEDFDKWHSKNKSAKILRTSKTHKNAYEPEDRARIKK